MSWRRKRCRFLPEAPDRSTGAGAHPVLTLRVQQAFGWTDTPRLVDGRVPLVLHLTDPAGRPAAVTSDLTSFWAGPYSGRARATTRALPEAPVARGPAARGAHEPRQAPGVAAGSPAPGD